MLKQIYVCVFKFCIIHLVNNFNKSKINAMIVWNI